MVILTGGLSIISLRRLRLSLRIRYIDVKIFAGFIGVAKKRLIEWILLDNHLLSLLLERIVLAVLDYNIFPRPFPKLRSRRKIRMNCILKNFRSLLIRRRLLLHRLLSVCILQYRLLRKRRIKITGAILSIIVTFVVVILKIVQLILQLIQMLYRLIDNFDILSLGLGYLLGGLLF